MRVPASVGTPHLCGSEEFCRAPSRKTCKFGPLTQKRPLVVSPLGFFVSKENPTQFADLTYGESI
jgi:hypothetical protein